MVSASEWWGDSRSLSLVSRWHTLESLKGALLQSFPVVRVGNLNQCMSSLSVVFTKEVGNAKFGDNVVGVSSRSHHTGAWLQHDGNLGFASLGCRGHRKDGLALAVQAFGSSAEKVNLTTES